MKDFFLFVLLALGGLALLLCLLGFIAFLLLVGALLWACMFMFIAFLVDYPLTWPMAIGAGFAVVLIRSLLASIFQRPVAFSK